jgi:hypothetical protein
MTVTGKLQKFRMREAMEKALGEGGKSLTRRRKYTKTQRFNGSGGVRCSGGTHTVRGGAVGPGLDVRWRGRQATPIPNQPLLSLAMRWSPPVLQGSVSCLTGTGMLPYIRPVDEGLNAFWP